MNHKRVYYDGRNTGLSSKSEDYSVDAHLRDLDTVVDALGLDRFSLYGSRRSGPIAIKYAATHPNRVSHLMLFCASADGAGLIDRRYDAMMELARSDWELAALTFAQEAYAWEGGQLSKQQATYLQETFTAEEFIALFDAVRAFDASQFLEQVKCPTLVLHRKGVREPPLESAQLLAARIPDAHLVLLEGDSPVAFLGDVESLARAINEFLADGEEATPLTRSAELASGTAIILFLDIADSTALTTQLGDAAYREKERALDASLRAAISDAGGTPVEGKVLGDGVMAVFTSARQAIEAAQQCRDLGNVAGLPLHLGIHAGDVVREGNNVHGGSVQVAARVQGIAAPGEILVSATVRDLARTSAGVAFEDRGEHELKGIAEPQRLFAVRAE